jgi:hypothetical protein
MVAIYYLKNKWYMPFLSSRTEFVTIIPLKATFVFPVHEKARAMG